MKISAISGFTMDLTMVPDWEKASSPLSNEDEELYWISLEEFKNIDTENVLSKGEIAAKILDDLDHIENIDEWIKEGNVYYKCYL